MIYTSSFFNFNCHHGDLISVSLSTPDKVAAAGHLDCFKPTAKLLKFWKNSDQSDSAWEQYCQDYWKLIADRETQIKDWLATLQNFRPLPHMTLACWEAEDSRCHRSLVARVIRKFKPSLWGGESVPQFQVGDTVIWTQTHPAIARVVGGNEHKIKAIYPSDHRNIGPVAEISWVDPLIPVSEFLAVGGAA